MGLYNGYDFAGDAARKKAEAEAQERIPLLVTAMRLVVSERTVNEARAHVTGMALCGEYVKVENYLIQVLKDAGALQEVQQVLLEQAAK